mmetsp:Transcript_5682/g.9364  ORF Transcript_5682/g.9364 Transcript_5682/m.9364 type:complete len:444 (+) Transcript_5682:28-1359(+)
MSLASYQAPAGAVGATGVPFQMNQPQQPLVTGPGGGLPSGPGPIAPAQRSDTRGEKCGDMCTSVDLFSGSDIISAIWSEDACECLVVPKGTTPVINFTMDEGKKKLQSTGQSSSQMVLCDTVTVGNEKNGSNWDKFYPLGNLCDPFPAGSGEYEGTPVSTYVSLLLAHSMNTASEYAKTTAGFTVPAGSKGKKGKIKKQKKQTLTLLCPGSFDQRQLAILNKAADQAGIPVRNFFNRGVASVTGVLDRSRKEIKNKTVSASTGSGSTNLYSVLSAYTASTAKEEKNDPIVLYLNVYAICNCSEATGSDSKRVYYYDAMLVQGEGGINALQVGSRLGFERLNTIAILGGNIPISSSSSSSTSSTSSTNSAGGSSTSKSRIDGGAEGSDSDGDSDIARGSVFGGVAGSTSRSKPAVRVLELHDYYSLDARTSDHRPVCADFTMNL